ncbi:uncharacterized protein LOC144513918 [Sander vitreus]
MEEKPPLKLPLPRLFTSPTNKKAKKRKTTAEKAATKRAADIARAQTRVNIGSAFQRWRRLKKLKGMKTDASVALFLLDVYDGNQSTSSPWKHGSVSESLSDRDDDFSVAGVQEPDVSSSDETARQQSDASYKAGPASTWTPPGSRHGGRRRQAPSSDSPSDRTEWKDADEDAWETASEDSCSDQGFPSISLRRRKRNPSDN